jgi:NADH-quinone oxidoreductase subunit H
MALFLNDPFGWIGQWLQGLLLDLGLAESFIGVLLSFLGAGALATAALTSTIVLIWLERKLVARIQDRLGPNRVGPYGTFQTVVDALKLLTKELITPGGADRIPYNLAPLLSVMSVVGMWGVVPLAPSLLGADLSVGVLYLLSIGTLGTLGVMLAGMSSNNKYALLGAFRTVAQMLSYTVPMVLALIVPTLLAGSMGLLEITRQQSGVWFIFLAPLAALVFFISSVAEVGRAPFDLIEAESEIVAGFHIEYSGLKFGMFFVAEFLHAFTIAAITTALFLGGWQGPWADLYPLLGLLYFFIKTGLVYFVVVWIRGSFPRIRIDQMNALNWKFITPLALLALIVTAVTEKLAQQMAWNRVLAHTAANGITISLTVIALVIYARRVRRRQESKMALDAQIAEVRGGAGD